MPNNRIAYPKILWGTSFANTLAVGYLLDSISAYDEPRAGFEATQYSSGVEDSWDNGVDYVLEFELRWIPQTDTSVPLATGWDGATGVRAFLAWARKKTLIRFYPDATQVGFIDSYLVEPLSGGATGFEDNGQRRLKLKIRNSASDYAGY